MSYHIHIQKVESIQQIAGKWSREDYLKLLDIIEFGDPGDASEQDLRELLFLALSEYEPQEAAEIVLRYKFDDQFNDGQYEQISNDMLKENVAEHYSDISYHRDLFDVHEFLYKVYNGKFPLAKASVITFSIGGKDVENLEMDKATALRLLAAGIDDHTLLKRLFKDQIDGNESFDDAQHIAWYLKELGTDTYQLITSDYWINSADFVAMEYDATLPED
jgi:hypothetical protein